MDTSNNRLLQSVGMGLLGVGVFLLVFAISNPNAGAKPFALFGMAWFLISAGLSYLPYVVIDILIMFTDWSHQKALHAHERDERALSLSRAYSAPPDNAPPVEPAIIEHQQGRNEHEGDWLDYSANIFELVVAGKVAAPHYTGGLDAVMRYKTWRLMFSPMLARLRLIEPIVDGQKTIWRAGVTPQAALDAIREARPLPAPFEPVPQADRQLYTERLEGLKRQ